MAKRKPFRAPLSGPRPAACPRPAEGRGALWLYGLHAVLAAAANPARRVRRLLAQPSTAPRLAAAAAVAGAARPPVETVDRQALDALLPPGARHQGIAVLAEPLPPTPLPELLDVVGEIPRASVVVLDQATDPRNVGAVLRSAAAFGVRAVVVQDRHAPPPSGALAKAACGALETVPLVRVTNLARALAALKERGFWCVGLDAAAGTPLAAAHLGGRVAVVLGGEGSGLRRLTRERCDQLARIPITAGMESLNLSAAAAIALYAVARIAREAGSPSPQ